MTICAHRFILHTVAEPRHADLLAQAEHDRRVRQAAACNWAAGFYFATAHAWLDGSLSKPLASTAVTT